MDCALNPAWLLEVVGQYRRWPHADLRHGQHQSRPTPTTEPLLMTPATTRARLVRRRRLSAVQCSLGIIYIILLFY
jgi:hypothetical protein